ncbi:MAG: TIGR03621 family F420-dependent LLM class oxidoreductase [Actinobacteria bacterium]|nr:TIGR03621 family F420-dependent LLM class oxidoreductase [Actinomycetota bacterium]
MARRFRFGMQLAEAASKSDWIEQARLAERLGYDIVVVPDHVSHQLAPFPALVSAAEATDRIRLGTLVIDNDFRHPMLLAQEAATVDLLTDGRLELGIGAGWMGQDYRRLGATFDPPSIRLARLKEAVEILGKHFRGEPFSFEGAHYRVTDAEPKPMPAQRPRPPLLIGGGGLRLLTFAAQQADIVSVFIRSLRDGSGFDVSELTATSYLQTTDHVRKVGSDRESGQEPELNVLLQYFEVTNDRIATAEEHARELEMDPEDLLTLPFELIGTIDQIVEDLIHRRERFGISYVTVLDRYLRDFAPVIERLSGS